MRRWFVLALAAMAAVPLGCTSDGNDDSTRHTVAFEVTGEGVDTASLTYTVGTKSARVSGTSVPWKKSVDSNATPLVATVSAQSSSGTTGSLSCRITIDGTEKVKNSSPSVFPSVTCTATE